MQTERQMQSIAYYISMWSTEINEDKNKILYVNIMYEIVTFKKKCFGMGCCGVAWFWTTRVIIVYIVIGTVW